MLAFVWHGTSWLLVIAVVLCIPLGQYGGRLEDDAVIGQTSKRMGWIGAAIYSVAFLAACGLLGVLLSNTFPS